MLTSPKKHASDNPLVFHAVFCKSCLNLCAYNLNRQLQAKLMEEELSMVKEELQELRGASTFGSTI